MNLKVLAYSKAEDGAYCVSCVLFGRLIGKITEKLYRLYEAPFYDWSCAKRRFREHELHSEIHKSAALVAIDFRKRVENPGFLSVVDVNNQATKNLIDKNREKMKSILYSVVLCGKQNIPLRGHRDDSSHNEDDSVNCGNFQSLLNYRVSAGDIIFKEHFNATSFDIFAKKHPRRLRLVNILDTDRE